LKCLQAVDSDFDIADSPVANMGDITDVFRGTLQFRIFQLQPNTKHACTEVNGTKDSSSVVVIDSFGTVFSLDSAGGKFSAKSVNGPK